MINAPRKAQSVYYDRSLELSLQHCADGNTMISLWLVGLVHPKNGGLGGNHSAENLVTLNQVSHPGLVKCQDGISQIIS